MAAVVSCVWTGERQRLHTYMCVFAQTRMQTHTHTRGIKYRCMWCSERRWHQNMQKGLCRRPEIFNDESIHYRIRSLCFCCHEMYTFIIGPPRTKPIVPLLRTTLDGKITKWKNNKQTQTQAGTNTHASAHTDVPKDGKHTHGEQFFSAVFVSSHRLEKRARKCSKTMLFCVCASFSCFASHPETKPDIWACNETFYANCICLWAN